MTAAAVEFTVVGVDRASKTFDDVGASVERSSEKIRKSSQDAGSAFEAAGESAGDLATWTATLGDGMATMGEQIGGPAGKLLEMGGNAILAGTALGDLGEGAVQAAKWVGNLGIAQKLQAMWTGVVTAAQWAWNAAMSANPIGVIIVGITLLVAGIVLLVKNWDKVKAAGVAAWEWIKGAWSTAASWLNKTVVQPVAGFFSGLWSGVRNVASGAWNGITSVWGAATGWFSGIVSGVTGVFSGISDTISAPFRSAFNGIKRAWNNTVGGKGFTVPDWIPGVGGKSFKIPMLATGGTIAQSGWAVVGEKGPELVRLPTGAQVYPNGTTAPGTGKSVNLTFHTAHASPAEVLMALRHAELLEPGV